MDSTAQNTTPVPQQVPPQQPPVAPAVPSSVSQISIGREQGPIQITADKEDDVPSTQQYVPVQTQAPSEVVQQPSPENVVVQQSIPQEAAAASPEILRPSTPEVAIPQELEQLIEKTPQNVAADTSLLPPEALRQHIEPAGAGLPVPQNDFGVKTLPISYLQAEKLAKKSDIKSGARWFADKVKYVWEKLNPNLRK